MAGMETPTHYSTTEILHWLDQTKVLLEETLARVKSDALTLSPEDRQMVAGNLVLIANVVTHLSQHILRPALDAPGGEEPVPLAKHPGILERLHDIHDRMQAVHRRLQTGLAPLN